VSYIITVGPTSQALQGDHDFFPVPIISNFCIPHIVCLNVVDTHYTRLAWGRVAPKRERSPGHIPRVEPIVAGATALL
jgi:hypothetical protein